MSAIVCGSFAFDHIMVFQDYFKNHILPDKIHMLNVSFLVPEMRREFGGCAGNIAYSLRLLGEDPIPVGTVGRDFGTYRSWMDRFQINHTYVREIENCFTAQAFITTDLDDNQITAFHPGSMSFSDQVGLAELKSGSVGIISPDGKSGMISHAEEMAALGIPFVFDPGQGMPMFNGDELRHLIGLAAWVTVNDYEWQLMQERTGYSSSEIVEHIEALIVTMGAKGSKIYTEHKCHEIPVAKARQLADPTGCGDAYRAGLLHGLMHGFDWETTGRIAALMGALKIECHGTQNHSFTKTEFEARYRETFGTTLAAAL